MTAYLLATDVELEVRAETHRADAKHGRQVETPSLHRAGPSYYLLPSALTAKNQADGRFAFRQGTWGDILVEEVAEALEEVDDPVALRAELVQVASVCLRWIRKLDVEAAS